MNYLYRSGAVSVLQVVTTAMSPGGAAVSPGNSVARVLPDNKIIYFYRFLSLLPVFVLSSAIQPPMLYKELGIAHLQTRRMRIGHRS